MSSFVEGGSATEPVWNSQRRQEQAWWSHGPVPYVLGRKSGSAFRRLRPAGKRCCGQDFHGRFCTNRLLQARRGDDHYQRATALSGLSRSDRANAPRIDTALEFVGPSGGGVAQHRHRLDGRYGMGGCRLLGLGDRHSQHRCAGRPRHPLHPLHDASNLLARARGTLDRSQCAFGGDGVAVQQQSRVSRLFWRHSARRADNRRDLAGSRIRDGRSRQMAQFDGRRVTQPDLADLPRL